MLFYRKTCIFLKGTKTQGIVSALVLKHFTLSIPTSIYEYRYVELFLKLILSSCPLGIQIWFCKIHGNKQ